MQKQLKEIFRGIVNDGMDFTEKVYALQDALSFMVEEEENPLEEAITSLLLKIVDFQDVGSSASVLSQYLTEYARNLVIKDFENHNVNLGISEVALPSKKGRKNKSDSTNLNSQAAKKFNEIPKD